MELKDALEQIERAQSKPQPDCYLTVKPLDNNQFEVRVHKRSQDGIGEWYSAKGIGKAEWDRLCNGDFFCRLGECQGPSMSTGQVDLAWAAKRIEYWCDELAKQHRDGMAERARVLGRYDALNRQLEQKLKDL